MEVPDGDGVDLGGLRELDLHPLVAAGQFDLEAFFAALVTVGEEGEVTGGGLLGGGGHRAAEGKVLRLGRHLGQHARALGRRLKVVDLHGLRRAERDGLGQDERQGLVLGEDGEG